ncbi:MAG: AbrB/MazE/SpoVT family DNA-binding domain-containing protein [Sporolactobacillus sp.]
MGKSVPVKMLKGNLIVQIPQNIADVMKIAEGTELFIAIRNKNEVVLKLKKNESTLDDLLSKITDENRHEVCISDRMGREQL